MNVKQGDLAITTHAIIKENIGMVVKVLYWHGSEWGRDDMWMVRVVGSAKKDQDGTLRTEALFPDAYLRPISGLPDTEFTDEQLTKPVNQPMEVA